jgi:hypothetical protein
MSWNTPEGGRMRRTASGASVYDGRSAISTGGTHVDYSGGLATALQSEASVSLEERDSAAQRSSTAVPALAHQIGDVGWQVSNGRSFEDATGFSLDTRGTQSFNELVSNASRFAERFTEGQDQEFAFQAYMQASASKRFGVPLLGGLRAEAGARGSAGWSARRGEIYEAAMDASRTDTSAKAYDDILQTFDRDSTSETSSQSSNWREAFAANLQELQSASQDQEHYTARSEAARDLASRVEREGAGFTANWDNAFLQHMAEQDRGDGHSVGMEEASRRWTSGDLDDRMWVERQAREFIDTQADQLLELPEVDGYAGPASRPDAVPASFDDIRAVGADNLGEAERIRANPPGADLSSPEFDGRRADATARGTAASADFNRTMVERSSDDGEKTGQLRKFTVQSRVQDGRDGEWDGFARSEPDDIPEEYSAIRDEARNLPWSESIAANGERQRDRERRMHSDQRFGTAEHYRTGAKQLNDE